MAQKVINDEFCLSVCLPAYLFVCLRISLSSILLSSHLSISYFLSLSLPKIL